MPREAKVRPALLLLSALRRASLPSARGDLLLQLGRVEDARDESRRAATMTRNGYWRALLLRRGEMLDRVNRC